MTGFDQALFQQNALRRHFGGTDTAIDKAIDAMNYTQLRNAARRAIVALAYQNADVDGNPEHESYANDHLHQASTFDMDQEREEFAESLMENGYPDDVAHANYYRRLLGIRPLGTDGEEMAPGTYDGWDA
jgi:hypothetical protein